MGTEVEVKRWGSSLGIILPKGFAQKIGVNQGDKIAIDVVKVSDFSDIFGSLKRKKGISGQDLKDLVREEWE